MNVREELLIPGYYITRCKFNEKLSRPKSCLDTVRYRKTLPRLSSPCRVSRDDPPVLSPQSNPCTSLATDGQVIRMEVSVSGVVILSCVGRDRCINSHRTRGEPNVSKIHNF
jgi:hypothetical protein